ncbi:hypothetical protein [Thermogutta sp.]|uniref:hypothetical protein n=1 Tax=Thermogutta sp. TaxID=1962930 RepID=UPI00321FA539
MLDDDKPAIRARLAALGLGILFWLLAIHTFRALKGGASLPVQVTVYCRKPVERGTIELFQVTRSNAVISVCLEFPRYSRKEQGTPAPSGSSGREVPQTFVHDRSESSFPFANDQAGLDALSEKSVPSWWTAPAMSQREWRWRISGSWVRSLRLRMAGPPSEGVDSVLIVCGRTSLRIPGDEVKWVRTDLPEAALGPDPPRYREYFTGELRWEGKLSHSVLPQFSGLWNYPGDLALMGHIVASFLKHPSTWFFVLWGAMGLGVIYIGKGRKVLRSGFLTENAPPGHASVHRGLLCGAGGFLLVMMAAAYLETREPRYFLQDDNFAIFYPVISRACEIAVTGRFPEWATYQFLGMPLAELGTFALTYPPTYFAYFFSRDVLGDPTWCVDVFCWFHLFLAYWAIFWLLSREGIVPLIGMCASTCWVLCGYALIACRSWYYMSPVFLFVPLLAIQLRKLESVREPFTGSRSKIWGWIFSTGFIGGLFYHAGNAQMWLYTLQLLGTAIVLRGLACRWSIRRWAILGSAALVSIAVAAPLLVPQLLVVSQVDRPPGPHEGIFDGLLSLVFPYPLAQAPSPCNWADPTNPHHGQFYFAGGVFTLLWLAGTAWYGLHSRKVTQFFASFWQSIAILALVLALGNVGGLWWLQSHFPIIGRAYHPFKYLPFFHLAPLLVGAKFCQHLFMERNGREPRAPASISPGARRAVWITMGTTLVLLAWHVFLADACFYRYGDRIYRPLPPQLAKLLGKGDCPARIAPITPFRSPVKNLVWGLGLDFPMVYGVESIDGYGEFVRQTREYRRVVDGLATAPLQTLQKYGVHYVLLHRTAVQPVRSPSWDARWAETQSLFDDFRMRTWCRIKVPIYSDEFVAVFPVADPDPRAFWEEPELEQASLSTGSAPVQRDVTAVHGPPREGPPNRRPAQFRCPGGALLVVNCADKLEGGRLVLNYLWRKGLVATADGQSLPIEPDAWGRTVITVPAGTREVQISYHSPWETGIFGGLFTLLVAILLATLAAPPLVERSKATPARTPQFSTGAS